MNCKDCNLPLEEHTDIRLKLCYKNQQIKENINKINNLRIVQRQSMINQLSKENNNGNS